ncbi:hypothetical protein GMD21_06770 [Ruminococcus faecis]|uniref:Enolase N-terminal domain-containing protein n=1 Tax=Mediterraneibacter faecis TaxID=592978 RepID=A0A844KD45_9FIRM|nr:hypothetical protein [Mediterraneibacter faecis]RGD85369.1 hypothetical protein DXD07_03280 [Ruminococcus sp. TF10-6]RGG01248.1 hypothetical protein DW983_01230 [Ruminococcus sp. AM49-8]RGG04347.1 hypothetical protein DW977_01230 [Ruminococcus sp. AM49-10BH]RGG24960.1 hypothetical protein DWY56_00415 [Ruminococcus sp. AF25-3LB]RGG32579.1 hypothetical protein DWY40_00590 [Ruminococcus sp. AF25-17]RGG38272.1 hypothetical protein DWY13_07525 [Ruminococcus sp. AF24-16]RGI15462.1 hypothetical 
MERKATKRRFWSVEPEVRNKLDLAIEIRDVYAREILDFAGNPAIEVEVLAGGEIIGKASMAGKNYSKKEQTEKQQVHIEEKIELLNSQIAPEIIGENVFEQRKIDTILKENGNEQTSFAISLAVARAAAAAEKIPLYRYLGGVRAVHPSMPQLIRKEEIEIEKIKEIKIDESTVLTKLFERILKEQNEGNKMILSQETAGTEDSFLVDLAVAANITMILVENRESAYYTVLNNRLLQLEEKISG